MQQNLCDSQNKKNIIYLGEEPCNGATDRENIHIRRALLHSMDHLAFLTWKMQPNIIFKYKLGIKKLSIRKFA